MKKQKTTKNKEITNKEILKRIEAIETKQSNEIRQTKWVEMIDKNFEKMEKENDYAIKKLVEMIEIKNKELKLLILNKYFKLDVLLSELNKKFINHEHLDKAVMLNLSKSGDGGK